MRDLILLENHNVLGSSGPGFNDVGQSVRDCEENYRSGSRPPPNVVGPATARRVQVRKNWSAIAVKLHELE